MFENIELFFYYSIILQFLFSMQFKSIFNMFQFVLIFIELLCVIYIMQITQKSISRRMFCQAKY